MDKHSIFRKKDLLEFQELFEQHTGEKIDMKTAHIKLTQLVRLVQITNTTFINEYGNENVTSRNSTEKSPANR